MKIIKTEGLAMREISIPQITGIYDPISGRNDGTITSQAPIVVSGYNLNMHPLGEITLCLASAIDFIRVIKVTCIYKCSNEEVIISLPHLEPGEYFPAVLIHDNNNEVSIYIFPESWIVRPYRCDRMNDFYEIENR